MKGANNVDVLRWIFETRVIESLLLDANHRTPLDWACRFGSWEAAQFLLDQYRDGNAALNRHDRFNSTSLHFAVDALGRLSTSHNGLNAEVTD